MNKRFYALFLLILMIFTLTACTDGYTTTITQETRQEAAADSPTPEPIIYEAKMYDNQGNNFLNFTGNSFTISPNKSKQYGWNTDGTWVSYYETSSVVTIEVDGNYIQSCGSTVIFKDTRLDMLEIPSRLSTVEAENTDGYTVSVDNQTFPTYIGLTNWWYGISEKGQHGEKIVLIQSQDGYNIGAFVGSDVTWEVASKLPKTTKITIDGLPLYIHRCNFTIIDSALMEKSIEDSKRE